MANQIVKLKKGSDYLYPYGLQPIIDTDNLLETQSRSIGWSASKTITEDCFVITNTTNEAYTSQQSIEIDGVIVQCSMGGNSGAYIHLCQYLRKGQVFRFYHFWPSANTLQLKFYGIKY